VALAGAEVQEAAVGHVELSLMELPEPRTGGSLARWAAVVSAAAEPCALLDRTGVVVALSPGCAAMFAVDARAAVGQPLVDGVLRLLDFNRVSGELTGRDAETVPPLLAMRGGLARGLVRVGGSRGAVVTADAVSTPVRDAEAVVGSLTFFAPVPS
jgi:hypothetical protein